MFSADWLLTVSTWSGLIRHGGRMGSVNQIHRDIVCSEDEQLMTKPFNSRRRFHVGPAIVNMRE